MQMKYLGKNKNSRDVTTVCSQQEYSTRGVRVYPYPRVYPTRPVPACMGRVRVDVLRVGSGTGTKSTGTGIPVFTRKEHLFSRCWSYIECFLFLP